MALVVTTLTVGSTYFYPRTDVVTYREHGLCVQCHMHFRRGFLARTNQGHQLMFCSFQCRDYYQKQCERYPLGYGVNLANAGRICRFSGCNRPCYVDGLRVYDYCGRVHAEQDAAIRRPSKIRLEELAFDSPEFGRLKSKFIKSWRSEKGELPAIKYILKVINPQMDQIFNSYVSGLPVFQREVEQLFHGTSLKCIMPRSEPCSNDGCGACSISTTGFDPEQIRTGAWQRFGNGFYFATNSSKSYDYPLSLYRSQSAQPRYRCMLICDIAPGRKLIKRENAASLQGPPQGFHSVHGRAKSRKYIFWKEDSTLNYDEVVVYRSEAIRPRYILILQNTTWSSPFV